MEKYLPNRIISQTGTYSKARDARSRPLASGSTAKSISPVVGRWPSHLELGRLLHDRGENSCLMGNRRRVHRVQCYIVTFGVGCCVASQPSPVTAGITTDIPRVISGSLANRKTSELHKVGNISLVGGVAWNGWLVLPWKSNFRVRVKSQNASWAPGIALSTWHSNISQPVANASP